jgi:hypothetical protein
MGVCRCLLRPGYARLGDRGLRVCLLDKPLALPKTHIALPLKFKEAYAWYKGSNRLGEEQFWCGKEGWIYLK